MSSRRTPGSSTGSSASGAAPIPGPCPNTTSTDSPAGAGRRWLDLALSACLAPRCAACGDWLGTASRSAVCQACWQHVAFFTPPLCPLCGTSVAESTRTEASGCALCALTPLPGISRAAALGSHAGALRRIVHALKFGRRPSLAGELAALLLRTHAGVLDGADGVVPVPLHASRRRQRGFNQAHEIARHLPVPLVAALRRRRHTPPQTQLGAEARRRNVDGAFALSWRARAHGALAARGHVVRALPRVADQCLVLVDDVWTTGATLTACAAVLREAGAGDVRALVIARAVPSRLR